MPENSILPGSIDEVLDTMEQMNEQLYASQSYLLIFGLVYHRVTESIRDAIADGRFEDGPRMEALDVAFANLYIHAYRQSAEGSECPASWEVPFSQASYRHSLMQHLLAGMNAHINLDLGHAAAIIAPGEEIHGLKDDFMRVNDILTGLTQEMQAGIGRVSPLLFLLDWIGQRSDERIANFSLVKARDFAWQLALRLAPLSADLQREGVLTADEVIAGLARRIYDPPGRLLPWTMRLIGSFESRRFDQIAKALK